MITPNDPADTDIGKAKLVARCINGNDTGKLEVPGEFGL